MPNTPTQLPNYDLPGAEWFSLAPNASIMMSGRRRIPIISAATSIPASTTSLLQGSVQLENPFTQTSGIYVHRAFLMLFPQGITTGVLTITGSLLALNVSSTPTAVMLPLGVPTTTQLSPVSGLVSIQERDVLVTWKDMPPFSGFPSTTVLNLTFQASVSNTDATLAHSIQPIAGIIYTRLDGFTE